MDPSGHYWAVVDPSGGPTEALVELQWTLIGPSGRLRTLVDPK